jgi:hypothetical protein
MPSPFHGEAAALVENAASVVALTPSCSRANSRLILLGRYIPNLQGRRKRGCIFVGRQRRGFLMHALHHSNPLKGARSFLSPSHRPRS